MFDVFALPGTVLGTKAIIVSQTYMGSALIGYLANWETWMLFKHSQINVKYSSGKCYEGEVIVL